MSRKKKIDDLIKLEDLPVDWESEITKIYSNGGLDDTVIRWLFENWKTDLKITPKKFKRSVFFFLIDEYEQFGDLVRMGYHLSKSYWLETAKQAIQSRNFNSPVFNKIMSSCFGMDDTISVDLHTGSRSKYDLAVLTPEEKLAIINLEIDKIKQRNSGKKK